MIHFWKPWDLSNAQGVYLDLLVTISMIRKLRNVSPTGDLVDFWCQNPPKPRLEDILELPDHPDCHQNVLVD